MTEQRVYRSEFAAYAVWAGMFSIPLLGIAGVLVTSGWQGFLAKNMLLPLVVFAGLALVTCAWLACYRLTIAENQISYRSWRRSWTARRADIAKIEASRVTPISRQPVGAYVSFKDGHRELIYTKVFSRAAIDDLLEHGSAA